MAAFDPATDVVTLEASRTCIIDEISSNTRGMCLRPYYDGSGRRRQALEGNGTDTESSGGGQRHLLSPSSLETGLRFQVSKALGCV
jgi:hypothetical protein